MRASTSVHHQELVRMKTIIVPLDGHHPSEAAIPVARAIAERADADVALMSATRSTNQQAERVAYVTALADELSPVIARAEVVVTDRPVAEAILAIAHLVPDGVVCMRAHGRGPLGTAVLGSTALEVLEATTEPVILVGPGVTTERFGAVTRLLVPLDGSEEAEAIIPLAVDVARQLSLEPMLLRVIHPLDDEGARHLDTSLDRAVKTFEDAGFHPEVEVVFSSNTPVSIVGYAQTIGASLIAMSTHLRRGLPRAVLGNATMATVHAASCPVIVQHLS
jgi:nucleotide-binding universal stress UspA family protein